MLLTRRCPGCRAPSRTICDRCRAHLARRRPDPVRVAALAEGVGLTRLGALWDYDACSRAVVLALKNGHRPDLAAVVARSLAVGIGRGVVDVVTWVPASGRGRRRRGYDQGAVLAGHVARSLGVPRYRLLTRVDVVGGRARSRAERLGGPRIRPARGAIGPGVKGWGAGLGGARVLLVDDVVTTGGSLEASVSALRAAGAGEVVGAVLAVVEESMTRRAG